MPVHKSFIAANGFDLLKLESQCGSNSSCLQRLTLVKIKFLGFELEYSKNATLSLL